MGAVIVKHSADKAGNSLLWCLVIYCLLPLLIYLPGTWRPGL